MLLKACLVVFLITVSLGETLSLPISEITEGLKKRLDLMESRLNAGFTNPYNNPVEKPYSINPSDMNYGSVFEAINWLNNYDEINGTLEYYTEYMKSIPLN
ncbi:Hypothetical protein CINCED_3A001545 [Cinara cedri]|uniref:Uncharacterized protein n=1 Tax=Cinara cedri TaxID=506608 RepID=A0A5E4MHC3_9HEMI|nr:Hypothetical protein CINCED_3A001545 [Cinara cedri]